MRSSSRVDSGVTESGFQLNLIEKGKSVRFKSEIIPLHHSFYKIVLPLACQSDCQNLLNFIAAISVQ